MHVGGQLILTGVDGSVMWAELRPDKDSERGRGSLCFLFLQFRHNTINCKTL